MCRLRELGQVKNDEGWTDLCTDISFHKFQRQFLAQDGLHFKDVIGQFWGTRQTWGDVTLRRGVLAGRWVRRGRGIQNHVTLSARHFQVWLHSTGRTLLNENINSEFDDDGDDDDSLWALSLPSSKSTFSQPIKEKCMKLGNENWLYNHLSSEKAVKTQVLHTVWCNISGEATGEIWNWSLLGVQKSAETKYNAITKLMALLEVFYCHDKEIGCLVRCPSNPTALHRMLPTHRQ